MEVSFDTDRVRLDAALKGMNQTALARRARLSRMTVSRFLRGKSRTPATAKKIAQALGEDIARYLVVDKAPMARQSA